MKNTKKRLILMAMVALLAAPAMSFAGAWIANDGDITDSLAGPGIPDVKLSANVQLYYDGEATGNYFSLASINTKGTKAYMTTSTSSKIYQSITEITTGSGGVTVVEASSAPTIASTSWAEVGK